jgi:hypothetical protein
MAGLAQLTQLFLPRQLGDAKTKPLLALFLQLMARGFFSVF